MFSGLMTRARLSCCEMTIFLKACCFLSNNKTMRFLVFVTIHSLSLSGPRTFVKSPSDHSSAVPPAAVTLLTSIVALFQDSPEPNQVAEKEQAAVKADAIVSSICWAATFRSRITCPGNLGTCFVSPSLLSTPATMGRCPYSRRSSWTAAVMSASISFTSVVVSPVVSKFPDGVRARAKCPDGSTVTGIRHHNFVL